MVCTYILHWKPVTCRQWQSVGRQWYNIHREYDNPNSTAFFFAAITYIKWKSNRKQCLLRRGCHNHTWKKKHFSFAFLPSLLSTSYLAVVPSLYLTFLLPSAIFQLILFFLLRLFFLSVKLKWRQIHSVLLHSLMCVYFSGFNASIAYLVSYFICSAAKNANFLNRWTTTRSYSILISDTRYLHARV